MKIKKLLMQNYRTFENSELNFHGCYTAICGQNDAGKSNIIRAIRSIIKSSGDRFGFNKDPDINYKKDYPKWQDKDHTNKQIRFVYLFNVCKKNDTGLFRFIIDYLKLDNLEDYECFDFELHIEYLSDKPNPDVKVVVCDKEYKELKAEEVFKKIQQSILVHNSTETDPYQFNSLFEDVGSETASEFDNIAATVQKALGKVAKAHKKELSELLGRLDAKYKVGISLPDYNMEYLPYNITLGDAKIDVEINDWGSGTKNRTNILLQLLRAKQISHSTTTASKITPVVIVEEPESFLHPSAQAEFGRFLQDIAEEFKVQVIVTTHSPYMLSKKGPESNILLKRKIVHSQMRETEVIETSGDNWMEPFGVALGLSNEEFMPWKDIFFNNSNSILMVEGKFDVEYYELLRDPIHGKNKLDFEGVVFDYDGWSTLKNPTLLRFLKNRCKKFFITYDLDVEKDIEEILKRNGFKRNEDYFPIGKNVSGLRNIEGLLPRSFVDKVNSINGSLVSAAMHGMKNEQESAKTNLKRLYVEEFKKNARISNGDFDDFYKIIKIINKAFLKNK
ncbi:ATP-dependent nuclease [Janthinobacterium sp. B9-8]|uniref:ATP-dependent nuclease n=1 Tax=Janthinobacterium sp. B9-8 TaxID=1236179 RepID=UPI000A710FF9|nr:AAA family ATPase [Janthinobacterium sp. B9-8]